jgi:hypothetical protein
MQNIHNQQNDVVWVMAVAGASRNLNFFQKFTSFENDVNINHDSYIEYNLHQHLLFYAKNLYGDHYYNPIPHHGIRKQTQPQPSAENFPDYYTPDD